jgi:DNA-directed RNA polymerase specialized sigma24 family protein
MFRTALQPARPAHPGGLIGLVRRVARTDRSAFTSLYQALAPAVAADLRAALPDPADAAAITSATFVEVWWLARFHTASDTDVPVWITGIATRRAAERLPAAGHPSSPMPAIHDRRNELALAALLDHQVPVGVPAT